MGVIYLEGGPDADTGREGATVIEKPFSKKFAESGSPAYDVLKNMKLTNDDQEAVAKAIAGDKEDPEKAAADWISENQDKVQAWLG